MTQIKICGLSSVEHALAATEAGADYIGMVFAASRRQVTPETAREIVRAMEKQTYHPQTVGVFTGTPATEVNRIAGFCGLDHIQLSGDEPWDYCLLIGRPLIKVIHVMPGMTSGDVTAVIDEGVRILKNMDVIYLLDTGTSNAFGGTGQAFDWAIARETAIRYPVIVAGGLTPGNVTDLINQVHPLGVDVSGGVESGGIKDPEKIKAFIRMVKQAEARPVKGRKP